MKTIRELNKWSNKHDLMHELTVLRWLLGGFLFYKGITFFNNSQAIIDIIGPKDELLTSMFIYHYVVFAHLAGGLFIVLGLLTRLSVAIQIPILIGAIIVNFISNFDSLALIQASLALIVSTYFLFAGSGKISVDYNLKMEM